MKTVRSRAKLAAFRSRISPLGNSVARLFRNRMNGTHSNFACDGSSVPSMRATWPASKRQAISSAFVTMTGTKNSGPKLDLPCDFLTLASSCAISSVHDRMFAAKDSSVGRLPGSSLALHFHWTREVQSRRFNGLRPGRHDSSSWWAASVVPRRQQEGGRASCPPAVLSSGIRRCPRHSAAGCPLGNPKGGQTTLSGYRSGARPKVVALPQNEARVSVGRERVVRLAMVRCWVSRLTRIGPESRATPILACFLCAKSR